MKRFWVVFGALLLWSRLSVAQSSFAPVAEKVMPSAVNISTQLKETEDRPDIVNKLLFTTPEGRVALGSGFVARADGYIATNRHVIEDAEDISVVTPMFNRAYQAEIVGVDPMTDLAVLKIDTKEVLQPVVFGNSDQMRIGDWVLAVGNPFGLGSSISAGIISAKSRRINDEWYDEYLQTDAAINQGNSGGPMFNAQGELVGINTAIFSDSGVNSGVGFALPSNQAKWVIERLIEHGKVERSRLGLELTDTISNDGKNLLIVRSLSADADQRWQVHDAITEIDGKPVASVNDFSRQIEQMPVNTPVKIGLIRDRESLEMTVYTIPMPEKKTQETPQNINESVSGGKAYPEYGMSVDQTKVVAVTAGGEADQKGVRIGDEIIKVDQHPALDAQNLDYYFQEALRENKLLRLDLQDQKGEPYFVELKPKEDQRDAD